MKSSMFLLLLVLAFLKCCYGGATNETAAIFVLGDSLYDPGNNDYLIGTMQANRPPYGESFFEYPTGRFCDGRQVTDFTAMEAGLPLWYAYLSNKSSLYIEYGANFASAGAGVLNTTNPGTLSLGVQLNLLEEAANLLEEKLGDVGAKTLLNKAIYQMSIGGNDYWVFYNETGSNATELEQEQYINKVIDTHIQVVKSIYYRFGGRKFAFQNVGPIGCCPGTRQTNHGDCVEYLQVIASKHNTAFSKVLKELAEELSGFKYLNFDYYTSLMNIIENPGDYGFNGSAVACCGVGIDRGANCGMGNYELCDDPSEYVFFDGYHPSEAANTLIAKLLWSGSPNVTEPLNFKELYELDLETENFGETKESSLADE